MDISQVSKPKKGNLITKTWQRCKSLSLGNGSKKTSTLVRSLTPKSKSWPRIDTSPLDGNKNSGSTPSRKKRVAPEGCFTVYVGPQKQRFVIKTEYANHPLFILLLEEAESEYGYNPEGPLALPCKVDIFCKVLLAMDDCDSNDGIRRGCGFVKSYGSYHHLSPSRMIALNQF